MYVKLYAKLLMMLQLNKLNNTHGPCDGCPCLKISWCTSHRVERVPFFNTSHLGTDVLFVHTCTPRQKFLFDGSGYGPEFLGNGHAFWGN